jgi:hypothetical protein
MQISYSLYKEKASQQYHEDEVAVGFVIDL